MLQKTMIKHYVYPSDDFDINAIWNEPHTVIINVRPGEVFKCADPGKFRSGYTTCIRGTINNITLTMLANHFDSITIRNDVSNTSEYCNSFALYINPQPNIKIVNNAVVYVYTRNVECVATLQCKYMFSISNTMLQRAYKNPKIYCVESYHKVYNAVYAHMCIGTFINDVLPAIGVMRGKYRVPKFVVIKIIKRVLPSYVMFRNGELCWIWD